MDNKRFAKFSLRLLDSITENYPRFASGPFQKAFVNLFGSDIFCRLNLSRYKHKMNRHKDFSRILIVVDVNIGDSILVQQSVKVLRFYFPKSVIDYACNQIGGELISGSIGANRVFNIFRGRGVPSKDDYEMLDQIIGTFDYSLVLNLSPFFDTSSLRKRTKVVNMYFPFGVYLLNLWKNKRKQAHISSAMHSFLHTVFNPLLYRNLPPAVSHTAGFEKVPVFAGNTIHVSHKSVEAAKLFLFDQKIFPGEKLMFVNPDSTSGLTQTGAGLLTAIIRKVLGSGSASKVLLSKGYIYRNIESDIISGLVPLFRKKVIVVPELPIQVFAALIDQCDVYVSGDCGPLHIAASRKETNSDLYRMRNETAVVSVFGATDSRIYGYDSFRSDHIASNQSAPARSFSSASPCRNITCINKWGKSCKILRCHIGHDADSISSFLVTYLQSRRSVYSKAA